MKFTHLIIVLSLSAFPFFTFAQTDTPASFDIDKYIAEIQRVTTSRMIEEERKFINTTKIREKAVSDYLSVTTNPRNPGPGETVSVSVESYLSDLNKATIDWSVNGKLISRSTGKTSFSFKNGSSGETTRISVSIVTNTGEKVTKELTFNPVGVTILWEADTYTPPFYKGKPLMTAQARVRVLAVPDAVNSKNLLRTDNLVFVWEKDGTVVQEASGYGKNSFSITGPSPYDETNVNVKVSSLNDAIQSELQIDLPLSVPIILFYENSPLLGVLYNRPLSTGITLTKKDFSVSAEPYFFSNEESGRQTAKYNWSLNDRPVINFGRAITLRNEQGLKGTSVLSLEMYGTKKLFQSASQSLTINFSASESVRPSF